MMIRSQDKKRLVNFNQCEQIAVYNFKPGIYTVETKTALLGRYMSEEKAVKVLDMIQKMYGGYATVSPPRSGISGIYNIPKMFQMPQDDEVEV